MNAQLSSVTVDVAAGTATANNVHVTSSRADAPLTVPTFSCFGVSSPSIGAGTLFVPGIDVTTTATINLNNKTMTLGATSVKLGGIGYTVTIPFPFIGNQVFTGTLPIQIDLPLPGMTFPLPI